MKPAYLRIYTQRKFSRKIKADSVVKKDTVIMLLSFYSWPAMSQELDPGVLPNKLARVQLTIPYVGLAGRLQQNGSDTSASRSGFGDLGIRFRINLPGSPALSAREFNKYGQGTIHGVSFVTSVPTGMYYD